MTTDSRATPCPATILTWIPWYPHDLDSEQRGAVEAHASGCRECRREIALLCGDEVDSSPVPDPERIYATVLARIESDHAEGQHSPGSRATEQVTPMSAHSAATRHSDDDSRDAAQASTAPHQPESRDEGLRRFALAASVAVALLSGGLVGAWLTSDPAPVYQTASAGPSVNSPNAAMDTEGIEVVFREDVEMAQISETLRAMGARITSGPSQLGVYQVELPASADAKAAARLLRSEDGVAIFAEPGRG